MGFDSTTTLAKNGTPGGDGCRRLTKNGSLASITWMEVAAMVLLLKDDDVELVTAGEAFGELSS